VQTATALTIFATRNDRRPLLLTDDPRATIHALLTQREPLYRSAADFSIDNSDGLGLVYFVTGGVGAGAYDYTIRATDPGGLYVEHEFTVTVTA